MYAEMMARSGRFEHSHWAGLGENLSKKFSTNKAHYFTGRHFLSICTIHSRLQFHRIKNIIDQM